MKAHSPKPANSQADTRLTPAERTARLLAPKPISYFNSPIPKRTPPGTSAAARARTAI